MAPGAGLLHSAGTAPVELRLARPVRVLSAGNHHPLLCQMEDTGGPAGLWVVKPALVLSRASDRGTFGILAELAGAEVCAWASIQAPRIGLTRFPSQVDATALRGALSQLEQPEREEIVNVFDVNRGRLAFCVRYLEGAVDLRLVHLTNKKWQASSRPDAVALLVADAYMRHDDRLVENPNAVWYMNRLVAIDHGSAFAALHRAGATGADLAARTQLHAPNFNEHVAFHIARLRATEDDWNQVTGRLEATTGATIGALRATWPKDLDEDDQNGQRQLISRMARFLEVRGQHVRDLVGVLREQVRRSR